jgi:hypothetical protein
MARIRTIKPEFFTHWDLYNLEVETGLPVRVAFSGLWTVADREGRFRWIPQQLKLGCLPYDEVDFSRVLHALNTRGFIEKYTVDGAEFGYIPGWHTHQVINNRETESSLPEPNEYNTLTRAARVNDATGTPLCNAQAEGKGREGKGKEGEGGYAEATPSPSRAVAVTKTKNEKPPAPTTEIWNSYSDAYSRRYGAEPVRNAKVNGQLAQLLQRLGADEAPAVAAWFVGHSNRFYVQKMHAVDCLLADAEKLRTEWATGRRVTSTAAQEADRMQESGDMWNRIIEQHAEVDHGQP